MFNFHKPRVYRSAEGCCICRAKSSSSRFTDSRKYETESMQCFNLQEPRHGEICNACVLLVKRYKRLPIDNKRHWGHVVDARAGPGTKSMAKHRKREEMNCDSNGSSNGGSGSGNGNSSKSSSSSSKSFIPEKFAKIFKKNRKNTTEKEPELDSGPSTSEESRRRLQERNANASTSQVKQSMSTDSDSTESSDEPIVTDCDTPPPYVTPSTSTAAQPTVVQFQTKTRSAAQKQQLAALTNATNNIKEIKKETGSNRRRMMAPKKNYCRAVIAKTPFFDHNNLQHIICCCGTVRYSPEHDYVVVDEEDYRPRECEKHRNITSVSSSNNNQPPPLVSLSTTATTTTTTATPELSTINEQQAKQPPPLPPPPPMTVMTRLDNATTPSSSSDEKPLKKHLLFFKRQSESFPTHVEEDSPPKPKTIKTEIIEMPSSINENPATGGVNTNTTYAAIVDSQSSTHSSTTSPSPMIKGSTVSSSSSSSSAAAPAEATTAATMSSSSTLILRTAAIVNANGGGGGVGGGGAIIVPVVNTHYENQQHQQLRQKQQQSSVNPATRNPLTIAACAPSPPGFSSLSSITTRINDNSSDSGFDENLHERRISTILVNSIPILSAAVIEQQQSPQQQHQQQQQIVEVEGETEVPEDDDSVLVIEDGTIDVEREEIISITEDEIIVDPSPPPSPPLAGRLVLTNDAQISGHLQNPHNIVLAGNEYGARIMQQQQVINPLPSPTSMPTSTITSNKGSHHSHHHHHHHRYKLNHHQHQINNRSSNNGNDNITSRTNGSCNRLRAIYNSSNNTIEHENGVTTILPASSLAATNQTAAMNAIVPSTVTISPAPSTAAAAAASSSSAAAGATVSSNCVGPIKKMTLTGHLQPLALTTNGNIVIQNQQQPNGSGTKSVVANQKKIIFVKHNA